VLVKLLFLMREETGLRDVAGFFDFVPYKFGPFSFVLYQDLSGLKRNGYVAEQNDQISLAHFNSRPSDWLAELSDSTKQAVRFVVAAYAHLPEKALIESVYVRYPWFASSSELVPKKEGAKTMALPAVYTIGYQGRSVDAFAAFLLKKGIKRILDVRSNPVSRNYGFAQRSLKSIAEKLEIEYLHTPELGIVSSERKSVSSEKSLAKLLDSYERDTLSRQTAQIKKMADNVREMPSVLLCYEIDPTSCHRSRLAVAVSAEAGLPIVHL
jgi:uncharacterized protein (DUF488 family)